MKPDDLKALLDSVAKSTAREIFEELYDDVSPIFHSVTLSKDTIKDRAEAYGVILEDEE